MSERSQGRIRGAITRLWQSSYARVLRYRGKRAVQRATAPGRRRPERCVFVAGVQRSGTNMLMDALERSWATDVIHERDPRAFDGYQMRDTERVQRLMSRSPARVFVIKALCELQDLPELMQRFSQAQTVWLYRDYRDVANSMTTSFASVPRTVRGIAEQGEAFGWWGRGLSDDTQAFLRSMVAEDPNAPTSAALLWYLRNRLFFERGLDRDERVRLVCYEDLVTDPEGELARVAAFAGIPFTHRLGRGIHRRSIGHRPEPDLAPAVRDACDGLMTAFEKSRQVVPGTK